MPKSSRKNPKTEPKVALGKTVRSDQKRPRPVPKKIRPKKAGLIKGRTEKDGSDKRPNRSNTDHKRPEPFRNRPKKQSRTTDVQVYPQSKNIIRENIHCNYWLLCKLAHRHFIYSCVWEFTTKYLKFTSKYLESNLQEKAVQKNKKIKTTRERRLTSKRSKFVHDFVSIIIFISTT